MKLNIKFLTGAHFSIEINQSSTIDLLYKKILSENIDFIPRFTLLHNKIVLKNILLRSDREIEKLINILLTSDKELFRNISVEELRNILLMSDEEIFRNPTLKKLKKILLISDKEIFSNLTLEELKIKNNNILLLVPYQVECSKVDLENVFDN